MELALEEAEQAIERLQAGEEEAMVMNPQSAHIRLLQHLLANHYNISSRSSGREPNRRVRFFRSDTP